MKLGHVTTHEAELAAQSKGGKTHAEARKPFLHDNQLARPPQRPQLKVRSQPRGRYFAEVLRKLKPDTPCKLLTLLHVIFHQGPRVLAGFPGKVYRQEIKDNFPRHFHFVCSSL